MITESLQRKRGLEPALPAALAVLTPSAWASAPSFLEMKNPGSFPNLRVRVGAIPTPRSRCAPGL